MIYLFDKPIPYVLNHAHIEKEIKEMKEGSPLLVKSFTNRLLMYTKTKKQQIYFDACLNSTYFYLGKLHYHDNRYHILTVDGSQTMEKPYVPILEFLATIKKQSYERYVYYYHLTASAPGSTPEDRQQIRKYLEQHGLPYFKFFSSNEEFSMGKENPHVILILEKDEDVKTFTFEKLFLPVKNNSSSFTQLLPPLF